MLRARGRASEQARGLPRRARMSVRSHLWFPLVGVLTGASAWALLPGVASAAEPEITSDTAAQFYDVRSPTGETVISRRRLTTTLGVSVYDLYDRPDEPNGPS